MSEVKGHNKNGLPKAWEWKKLGEICDKVTKGGTPTTYGFAYVDEGINFIKVENIENGKVDLKSIKTFISTEAHNYQKKSQLEENDLLFSIAGTIGETCLITKDYLPANTNQALAILRGYNKNLSPKFLTLQLNSTIAQIVKSKARGGAMNNISLEDLKQIDLVVPPKIEQDGITYKIEELFSELDKSIEQLKTAQQQLKVYRQSVLSAGTSGMLTGTSNLLSNTLTIGVPDQTNSSWEIKKLIEVAKLESGHTPRKDRPEYWANGNIFWLSLQDIKGLDGKIAKDTKYKTNDLGIENSSARLLPEGTVCFCRDISVGYVTIMGREMSTTQHFANWICGNKLNNKFLMYAFMASRDSLIRQGQGTTVKTIYMPELKELRIQLPAIGEQSRIVEEIESRLSVADKLEETITNSLQQAEALRQSILKKAFEGRL